MAMTDTFVKTVKHTGSPAGDKHADERAMFRTIADEVLNERVDLIEHQLAHNVKHPLGRAYNRTSHLPARKDMLQRWADEPGKMDPVLLFPPKA